VLRVDLHCSVVFGVSYDSSIQSALTVIANEITELWFCLMSNRAHDAVRVSAYTSPRLRPASPAPIAYEALQPIHETEREKGRSTISTTCANQPGDSFWQTLFARWFMEPIWPTAADTGLWPRESSVDKTAIIKQRKRPAAPLIRRAVYCQQPTNRIVICGWWWSDWIMLSSAIVRQWQLEYTLWSAAVMAHAVMTTLEWGSVNNRRTTMYKDNA